MEKAQLKCADMGVKAPNYDKVKIYVLNIHGADIFTEKEFIEWEGTKKEEKTWVKAKTYFGALYKSRRSYESNIKTHWSSFETAHSFTQNPQNGSKRSTAERSADTPSPKVTKKSPTNQWVEYSDSLEDSLLKAKEYAATITSRVEADQTSIMAELKEQRNIPSKRWIKTPNLWKFWQRAGWEAKHQTTHVTAGRKRKRSVRVKTAIKVGIMRTTSVSH